MFQNPMLAETLESLGREGRDLFYKGDVARRIGDFMKAHDGFLSYEDLAAHRSEWVEPVSVDYRGFQLWELPPNGQGIAALQILGILKQHDIAAFGFGSADHIHYFTEAKKLAFEDRAKFYGDPAFHKIPVTELISDDYARKRNQRIEPKRRRVPILTGTRHWNMAIRSI